MTGELDSALAPLRWLLLGCAVPVVGLGAWLAVRRRPLPGPLGWGLLKGDREYMASLPPERVRFQGLYMVAIGAVFLFDAAISFQQPWMSVGTLAQLGIAFFGFRHMRRYGPPPHFRRRLVLVGVIFIVTITVATLLILWWMLPRLQHAGDNLEGITISGAISGQIHWSSTTPCRAARGGQLAASLSDPETQNTVVINLQSFHGPGTYQLRPITSSGYGINVVTVTSIRPNGFWWSTGGTVRVSSASITSASGSFNLDADRPHGASYPSSSPSMVHVTGTWTCGR